MAFFIKAFIFGHFRTAFTPDFKGEMIDLKSCNSAQKYSHHFNDFLLSKLAITSLAILHHMVNRRFLKACYLFKIRI
jgi:hypothetical protein